MSVGLYDTEPDISEHFCLLFQNLCASQATNISNDSELHVQEKPEETIHLILLKHSLKKKRKKSVFFSMFFNCYADLPSISHCNIAKISFLILYGQNFMNVFHIPSL